jgi:putative glutamine amidotransferase
MKAAPLILIAPSTQRQGIEFFDYSVSLSDAYPRAVGLAGGIPWILSCTPSRSLLEESVRRCDGVFLSGGDDVQPELYRSKTPENLRKTLSTADPQRDLTELMLIEETFRQRKPLLAICRGMQLLNVAFGGTLIVDIPTELPHAINHTRLDMKDKVVHDAETSEGSLLTSIFGKTRIGVNSSHHQAILKPAAPFQVTAQCDDGVAEALEFHPAERHLLPYLLAVQFHPERMVDRYPEYVELFRSFVEACAKESKRSL